VPAASGAGVLGFLDMGRTCTQLANRRAPCLGGMSPALCTLCSWPFASHRITESSCGGKASRTRRRTTTRRARRAYSAWVLGSQISLFPIDRVEYDTGPAFNRILLPIPLRIDRPTSWPVASKAWAAQDPDPSDPRRP
jgi:hypothetical protein